MTADLSLSSSETFTVEGLRSALQRMPKSRPTSSVDLPAIEQAVRMIWESVGDYPDREGLLETPRRVAKMYAEMFSGLAQSGSSEFAKICELRHRNLSGLAGVNEVNDL